MGTRCSTDEIPGILEGIVVKRDLIHCTAMIVLFLRVSNRWSDESTRQLNNGDQSKLNCTPHFNSGKTVNTSIGGLHNHWTLANRLILSCELVFQNIIHWLTWIKVGVCSWVCFGRIVELSCTFIWSSVWDSEEQDNHGCAMDQISLDNNTLKNTRNLVSGTPSPHYVFQRYNCSWQTSCLIWVRLDTKFGCVCVWLNWEWGWKMEWQRWQAEKASLGQ